MQQITCQNCRSPMIRTSNSQKHCATCRIEISKYKEYRAQWQRNKKDTQATQQHRGKIACAICGKYYKKPISHAWQRHGVHEREYKASAGLDHKKGIIPAETREILREHIKDNYNVVVVKNLLTKGKRSRFVPNDPRAGRYQRSAQTLARLKKI